MKQREVLKTPMCGNVQGQPLKELKWSVKLPNQRRERNGIKQTCQILNIKRKRKKEEANHRKESTK